MSFDAVVGRISQSLPDFNDYALRGIVTESIDSTPDFIDMVFREGFKYIDANIQVLPYEIVSPEERVRYELSGENKIKSAKPKLSLNMSHLRLVKYKIKLDDDILDV